MNKPLIVVVGETASGKSSLAMDIAMRFKGEIISADSWAVYKGMDIGTAKPSKTDQEVVPHHLIDIVNPDEDYTAGLYKEDALTSMNQIFARGNLPIIVGGTGLYIDGVLFDFSFMKSGSKVQRQQYNSLSIAQLLDMISTEGYDLTGVDKRNKRRLIRVLETGGEQPKRSAIRDNTLVLGVKIDRQKLRDNIQKRVETMFQKGLKFEVLKTAEKYGWDCEGMQGIGYKEFADWHQGSLSMQKVNHKIIRNTLALAKRQRTWFKRNRDIIWVTDKAQAIGLVTRFLEK